MGFSIEATVWEPGSETFSRDSYHTTDAPIQTGKARRSSPILSSGLYRLPTDLEETEFYNVGRKLPVLNFGDGERYVFVRGINDFYNNRNYIWAAKPDGLTIAGTPGSIPIGSRLNDWIENDGIDAIMQAGGTLVKILRDHRDINVQTLIGSHSSMKEGPMWKTNGGRWSDNFQVKIPVDGLVPQIGENSIVKLKFAIYNTVDNKTFSISVNGHADKIVGEHVDKDGEKIISADIPIAYFFDENSTLINPVVFNFETSATASVYDFAELYFDCEKSTDGYLLVDNPATLEYDDSNVDQFIEERLLIKVEPGFSGQLKVKSAIFAVDMTEMGNEKVIPISDGSITLESSPIVRYLYFTKAVKNITFSPEKELNEINLLDFDYLAIAQADPNYFTQYDKNRPAEAKNGGPWDCRDDTVTGCMQNIYNSNLYSTWETATGSNGKTMNQVLVEDGFLPKIVKLEDIVDVYGGGLVSPQPIISLMKQDSSESIKSLCLVGSSSLDTRKQSQSGRAYPFYPQFLGIPANLIFGPQIGYVYTDDFYSNNDRVAVGRLLVYSDSELAAWIQKRIDFKPGDLVNLVSGENVGFDFGREQERKLGILPATLLRVGEPVSEDPSFMIPANLNTNWRLAIATSELSDPENPESEKVNNATLSIYQGHGGMYYLSSGSSVDEKVFEVGQEVPQVSNFMFMTCNSGLYFLNSFNVGRLVNLSYMFFNGRQYNGSSNDIGNNPNAEKGAVNIIASVGLASASWENSYTRLILLALRDNPDLTWGEAFNLKYNLSQGDTSRTYHLFGDPAMRVMKQNPRRIAISQDKLFKDELGVSSIDERLTNLNVDYAKVNSDGTFSWMGSLQPLNEDLRSRAPLVGPIDLSTIPNVTSDTRFKVRVTSDLDLGDAGNLPIFWAMSELFKIDRVAPNGTGGKFESPMYMENVVNYTIDCKVEDVVDDLSPITSYRFILETPYSNEIYAEIETSEPNTQFTIDLVSGLEQYQGLLKVDCYAADIWGNGLNSDGKAGKLVATQYFNYHVNDRDTNFDLTDSDNDGLPDAWEIYHFGDLTSVSGSDIYQGSNVTYRETYYSGKLPMSFTLKIKEGWNLISIPTRVSDVPVERAGGEFRSTLDEIRARIDSAYYYDSETQQYKPLDLSSNIQSSQGFWAFAFEDQKPLTFSGVSKLENQTDYQPGWNLFGSNSIQKVPNSTDLGPVFDWTYIPDESGYIQLPSGSDIFPLKGYWIKNSSTTVQSSN